MKNLPADEEATSRLAAAVLRLTVCLRTGDLATAATAVGRAELMLDKVPGRELARNPDIRRRVLSGRAAVELWSGRLDEAARILGAGVADEAASGRECERASLSGRLALVEALRGRLGRAAELAEEAACRGERAPAVRPRSRAARRPGPGAPGPQ